MRLRRADAVQCFVILTLPMTFTQPNSSSAMEAGGICEADC
jgi:hypothetical protein